ncbi:NmrA/HSCARG family protein [Saccharopolyspora sp. K220]|uniref:NmrA/HSCARG family protein n=1 Tax=Saccharopolyspora soli TaxID=2926618 RepID=UPI001F580176|nr:NmrA/HSCARG family protein [Saccharopolyspora soli]MCI2417884.1 NmrA/HSCARG family protein [Saccharopolyspora soli]
MDEAPKTILVMGATGRQGGTTAKHLRAGGWRVRALVRDADRPAVQALAAAGVELAVGDLDDPDSLEAAAVGVHGIFGVTPDGQDLELEVQRGRRLADAAATAGVVHFVFASVGGADRDADIPYWRSKWQIEQYIRALDLPATILRPVRFMENHTIPGLPLGGIRDGALLHLFGPDVPVQLIAADDIGAFAALAFGSPAEYLGRAIEIAGDELTSTETVALIGQALGREITYQQIPGAAAGLSDRAARAFATERMWHANIPALRKLHPNLLTFPDWLRRGGAARIEAILSA